MLAMANFEERYRELTDEQLLEIAAAGDDLEQAAQDAFNTETDRRGISERAAQLHRAAIEARRKKLPMPEPGFDPDLLQLQVEDIEASPELQPDKQIDLAVVERFRDLVPAQLALGALRSAGIDATLRDENMVRMHWLYSNALGGVRLVVPLSELDAAIEILNSPTPSTLDAGTGDLFQHPVCPNCGSTETFFEELDQKWSRGSFFVFPLPFVRDEWHCESCGHYWKAPQE
jgi:rubredoxin